MKEDTQYYNRETGKLEKESILGDRWLRLAYLSPIRGALQWPLFSHALFSRLMGWYLDRPSSVKRIAPTVRQLGINMDEVIIPEGGFTSFNDFFARELKPSARPLPQDPNLLISPADCRLTVYPLLTAGLVVPVKGTPYSMADLLGLQGSRYARAFDGGSLMVCRLCPADYHRYHFPIDGTVVEVRKIPGTNAAGGVTVWDADTGRYVLEDTIPGWQMIETRDCVILDTEYGLVAILPIGMSQICSCNWEESVQVGAEVKRGDPMGYFLFGGSDIVMVFQRQVEFDLLVPEDGAGGLQHRLMGEAYAELSLM